VICSQHGLDSLKGDVEAVTRCFARESGPIVLVGHSYGGTLITRAGVEETAKKEIESGEYGDVKSISELSRGVE